MKLCDSGGTIYYGIPNVSKHVISIFVLMMYKSIITNICSINGINMLLYYDIDMDSDGISFNNTCVSKPLNSEYCCQFRL